MHSFGTRRGQERWSIGRLRIRVPRPPAVRLPAMTVTEVQMIAPAEVAAAAEHWGAVEALAGQAAPLACTWTWIESWLDQYAKAVPHEFAIACRDGLPFGAALVTRSRASARADLGIRRLHLGTFGEPGGASVFTEWNGLLSAPGARREFATALLERLHMVPDWDELRFDAFDPEHLHDLEAAAPGIVLDRVPSPYMDLRAIRAEGMDVLSTLRKGPRSRIRRTLRELGEVELQWAADAAEARDMLDELVALHEERWRADGLPGAFADGRVLAFHQAIAARLVEEGRAVVCRVRAGGMTLGCICGYVDRNRMLFYQSGIATLADPKLKPGLVLHVLCMQASLERGLDAYDFLVGDSRYKRELSDSEGELYWAALARRRPRPLVSTALRRIARRPRRLAPVD